MFEVLRISLDFSGGNLGTMCVVFVVSRRRVGQLSFVVLPVWSRRASTCVWGGVRRVFPGMDYKITVIKGFL